MNIPQNNTVIGHVPAISRSRAIPLLSCTSLPPLAAGGLTAAALWLTAFYEGVDEPHDLLPLHPGIDGFGLGHGG